MVDVATMKDRAEANYRLAVQNLAESALLWLATRARELSPAAKFIAAATTDQGYDGEIFIAALYDANDDREVAILTDEDEKFEETFEGGLTWLWDGNKDTWENFLDEAKAVATGEEFVFDVDKILSGLDTDEIASRL